MKENIKTIGQINLKINHICGKREQRTFYNQLLNGGRKYLISNLIERSPSQPIFIKNILFGNGGTTNGDDLQQVSPERETLFGVTKLKKQVVAQVNPDIPTQLLFTVVISEAEGNDFTLNEMGLELSDGTLFSLATFQDFNKTDQMELIWSWSVWFV